MQHGPRPPSTNDEPPAPDARTLPQGRSKDAQTGQRDAAQNGTARVEDTRDETGMVEPSASVFESIGLGGENLLPGVLFLGGIILALMILMRGTRRSHTKRSNQTRSMENPSDRLAEMHRQASMSMEPATRALVEIEEVGRRFGAMLDNKAARLEQLLEDADERIARLESVIGAVEGTDTGSERTPGIDPSVLDRARIDEDRAARGPGADRPLTISDARGARMSETQRLVWGLSDEGCDATEIAARLDVPVGQIELMLNLRRGSG